MKRKAFTLIEVMVSLSLLAVLLGTLFFYYQRLAVNKSVLRPSLWDLQEESFARKRLERLMPGVEKVVTTEANALVFLFDNGPHADPLLSGTVLGSLAVHEQNLYLTVWPAPETRKSFPSETSLILDHVETLAWGFYFPPSPKKVVDPEAVGVAQPLRGWQSVWRKSYETLPPLMRLEVTRKGEPLAFYFDLPKSPHKVTY